MSKKYYDFESFYWLYRKTIAISKVFGADISLKYSQFGYNTKGIAVVLENIVYLELRRRGYEVYVGEVFSLAIFDDSCYNITII